MIANKISRTTNLKTNQISNTMKAYIIHRFIALLWNSTSHFPHAAILAGLLYLILAAALQGAAGDPDLSFAGTGRTRFGFGFGEDFAYAVAAQPDGKIVVAGSSGDSFPYGNHFSLVRYDTNDLLDATFGNGGKVTTRIFPEGSSQANALAIQPDGKIILAGIAYNGTNFFFALARYGADGILDGSFGTDGVATTGFGIDAGANAMALQPDGKIVLAGSTFNGGGQIALARYASNGSLDPTFGVSGKVVGPYGRGNASSVAVQSSGKIIVAGSVSNNFAVVRYTSGGALDTTFGSSPGFGLLALRYNGSSAATALAIQPGEGQSPEMIIVAGNTEGNLPSAHNTLILTRLDVNGFQDFLFGFFGIATFSISPAGSIFGDFPTSVLIQGAGSEAKIIVAGYTNGVRDGVFIARFRSSTLDSSFDFDGKAFPQFSVNGDEDHPQAMAFAPGGKLVVAGSTAAAPNNHDFALARFNLADGSLDMSFDQDGIKLQDLADRSASAASVAVQPDGKIVVAGNCYNGTYRSFALARLNPTGGLDPAFGSNGRAVVPIGNGDSQANAVAIQPDGKIVAAGYATNDIAVVRLNTDGTLDTTFDGDGIAITSFSTNNDVANAIALQPDGRITVAGWTINGSGNADFATVRYRTNGSLDQSFNLTGKATTAFGTKDDTAACVSIQPDGKIVTSGYATIGGHAEFALTRYATNGIRDMSFGTSGRVTTAVGDFSGCFGQAIQRDGKIVVAGFSYRLDVDGQLIGVDLNVIRYNTNGVLDNTFGTGGIVTTTSSGGEFGGPVALQSDAKILVSGVRFNLDTGSYESVMVRFLPTGEIDSTYGIDGTAVVDFGAEGFSFSSFTTDSLDRPIIAGSAGGVFGVARLQADPHLKISSVTRLPNRHTALMGTGVPGGFHTVEGSTNLAGPFTAVGDVIADETGRWQSDDASTTNSPARFYRLVLPQVDPRTL